MTIAASATELRTSLKEEREATGRPPTKRAFADFHIHTRFSRDSILTEEKFIEKAIERGLTHVASRTTTTSRARSPSATRSPSSA